MQYDLCNKHLFRYVLSCVEMPLVIYALEQMFLYDTSMESGCVRKVADTRGHMV
jgi:hypothetical protein